MIESVSIRDLAPTNVLKITMKDPWTAVPRTGKDGEFWLDIRRPRTHHALYLQEFFAIVVVNMPGIRSLHLRVPDFRTVGRPCEAPRFYHLFVGYDFVHKANVYDSLSPINAEVLVTSLVGNRISQGSAPKINAVPHYKCAPVSLT